MRREKPASPTDIGTTNAPNIWSGWRSQWKVHNPGGNPGLWYWTVRIPGNAGPRNSVGELMLYMRGPAKIPTLCSTPGSSFANTMVNAVFSGSARHPTSPVL